MKPGKKKRKKERKKLAGHKEKRQVFIAFACESSGFFKIDVPFVFTSVEIPTLIIP